MPLTKADRDKRAKAMKEVKEELAKVKGGKGSMAAVKKANDNLKTIMKEKPRQSEIQSRNDGSKKFTSIEKALRAPRASGDLKYLQNLADQIYIFDACMKQKDPLYDIRKSKNPLVEEMLDNFKYIAKAQTAGSTLVGFGDEFVPTDVSANFIENVRTETLVQDLFGPDVPMPTNPWVAPAFLSGLTLYAQAESTDDNAANYKASRRSTSSVTYTAQKFVIVAWSPDELEEDSVVPFLPILAEEAPRAAAEGLESAIINGDQDATHRDSPYNSPTDPEKKFTGLRKSASDVGNSVNAAASATLAEADLRGIRRDMKKYSKSPTDLAIVTSYAGYWQMYNNFTNMQTLDTFGPNALILNGEIGKWDGIPVIVSGQYPETMDANGVIPAVAGTKTSLLLVNRRSFRNAIKGTQKTETERFILTGQSAIVMSLRKDFQRQYHNGTTEKYIGEVRNVALS